MVTDGWNLDRVNEFCEKHKITLKVIYMETNEYEENTVLAQSPKADEEILVVSNVYSFINRNNLYSDYDYFKTR